MDVQTREQDRVRQHTAPEVLDQIEHGIECSLRSFAFRSKEEISERIDQIDREWDIERVLEANAATLALTGAVLGATVDKRYLLLTCGVLGFLLEHALSGWCPPVPVFRRLGFRTRSEMDREKFALKALRGDFANLISIPPNAGDPAIEVLQAVNR